jgi:hypothetical protein
MSDFDASPGLASLEQLRDEASWVVIDMRSAFSDEGDTVAHVAAWSDAARVLGEMRVAHFVERYEIVPVLVDAVIRVRGALETGDPDHAFRLSSETLHLLSDEFLTANGLTLAADLPGNPKRPPWEESDVDRQV